MNGKLRFFDSYGRMLADSKVPFINYLDIMSTAKKTNQIIMVVDHTLTLFSKANGKWTKVVSSYCGYGKNGFKLANERREGDKTTPVGAFTLPLAFGPGKNPGTSMTYRQITKNSYWSGDYDTYNTWVESSYRVPGEHLIDYEEYKYAMAIGFNMNPTVYKRGSAIFLHCKSVDRWYTSGCVSVPENVMLTLMKKTKNGAYMVIVPERTMLRNY
jgi:L,D-peptidoglycan transpeptidase YkuD (ErfK/YbiS/YcfS/YnhG family)